MNKLLGSLRAFLGKTSMLDRAYIVGGAVRDIVSGVETKDIDIAFNGDALKVAREFADSIGGSFVLLNERHETARIVKGKNFVDISRMRGQRIEHDLFARDITINAMALPLSGKKASEVIDPAGGMQNLKNKVIRMVSENNLKEDPIRILRIYRFSSSFGFRIDKDTRRTAKRLGDLIRHPAVERVMDELRHILIINNSYKTVFMMAEDGLLPHIFPEIKGSVDAALIRYRKAEEIINDVSSYLPYKEEISLYFRDDYRKVCTKLSVLFSGLKMHEAAKISRRMKLSNREKEFITNSLEGGRRVIKLSDGNPSGLALIRFLKKLRDDIYPATIVSITLNGKAVSLFSWRLLKLYHNEIRPRTGIRLITGDDLIRELKLKPSPLFKKILSRIEDMTLTGKIKTKKEALKEAGRLLSLDPSFPILL
jgi:tRNA nucleotidyltransferase/poly(A) polymerase